MKIIKLNITDVCTEKQLVIKNIKKALETNYCVFLEKNEKGDMFF